MKAGPSRSMDYFVGWACSCRRTRRAHISGLVGLLAAAMVLLAALPGLAQPEQPEETLPGFKPNQVYSASGIDNVNLYSGDPSLTVPLGPAYTLGPKTKWQLTAHYSSKFWALGDSIGCGDSTSCRFSFVSGMSTLGAGWKLELGAIVRKTSTPDAIVRYSYLAPDGSAIPFCQDQDQPYASCVLPSKTLDGRHLRLRDVGGAYEVDFPDGSVQHFGHAYSLPQPPIPPFYPGSSPDFYWLAYPLRQGPGGPVDQNSYPGLRYGLDWIKDSFGTKVLSVAYSAGKPFEPQSVVLNPDNPSGSRTIMFDWGQTQVSDADNGNPTWSTLSSLTFPTANGPLTVSFEFLAQPFPRPDHGGISYPSGTPFLLPFNAAVPLLSAIRTSGPSTTETSYTFSYFLPPDLGSFNDQAGALKSLTLPTGGRIAYEYGPMGYRVEPVLPEGCPAIGLMSVQPLAGPLLPGDDWDWFQSFADESAAVVKRTATDPTRPEWMSQTKYCRKAIVGRAVGAIPVMFRQVLVLDPEGMRRHLMVSGGPPSSGLEVVREYFDPSAVVVRTLVNCHSGSPSRTQPRIAVCGMNDGTVYFEQSAYLLDYSLVSLDIAKQKSVTWYGPIPRNAAGNRNSGGDCSQATTSCWQSEMLTYNATAGEYETEKKSSNTGLLLYPADSRTTTTHWTPNVDASHWLLKLFNWKRVDDNYPGGQCPQPPCSSQTDYNFNPDNGFLNTVSVSKADGSVLRRAYGPDGAWNPSNEVISADSPDGSLTGFFVTNRTFQNGLVLTSQRDLIPWKRFDVTRDVNAGLITKSRDPNASLETRYDYDALGRLTKVTPPGGEAAATYRYSEWNPTAPVQSAYVLAKKGIANPSATDDGVPAVGSGTVEAYQFDGFGRILRQVRRLPNALSTGSYLSFQETRYDVAGRRTFLSEWAPCAGTTDVLSCFATSAATGTTWSSFDFLGRPLRITAADGSVTTKSFDDPSLLILNSDFTEMVTQTRTYTDSSGHTVTGPLTGGSRKDILGRTLLVAEPGPPPYGPVTEYKYNTLDKLAFVNVAGTGVQPRTFNYDLLGFLRSETHPEKGTTIYSLYDALGNALTSTEADGTVISRTYDTAGRPTTVKGRGQSYVDNVYDGGCNAGSMSPPFACGKLTRSVGHNPMANPAMDITEDFGYSGLGGRLSDRTTIFSSGSLPSVTEHWFYDSLGSMVQYDHPRKGGDTAFVVSTAYSTGLPVTEYANGIPVVTAISYQPSGGTKNYKAGINAGHDVTTTIEQDPSLMPRPHRISAVEQASGTTPFDTGTYAYDLSGNITAMGSDTFSYDAISRLTLANLPGAGSQAFTYDVYGNMLSKGGITYTVNPATNRVGSPYHYDDRGNVTGTGAYTYTYDALDRQVSHIDGEFVYNYIFSGENERLVRVLPPSYGQPVYTLRDEGKRVAAEYVGSTPSRDNVFLGNLLVASLANVLVGGSQQAWTFHSSDHLGTPRLGVGLAGDVIDTPKYWPYGEWLDFPQTNQRLRLAAMENDTEAVNRYYDHARSHDGALGRFLSPDLLGGRIGDPQSWNRYSYAESNPVKFIDPNGREAFVFIVAGDRSNIFSAFGHAALYVTSGARGVSFGGLAFDRGVRDFLEGYANRGSLVKMYKLATTPVQDQLMVDFLRAAPDGGRRHDAVGASWMIRENCSTAVGNTLRAAGVISEAESPESPAGVVDTPRALQNSLERGSLSTQVETINTVLPGYSPSVDLAVEAVQNARGCAIDNAPCKARAEYEKRVRQ